jgi:hypothetical protein
MQSASRIMELVAPGGLLVLSGFDEGEQRCVREAFSGMRDVALDTDGGWVGMVLGL